MRLRAAPVFTLATLATLATCVVAACTRSAEPRPKRDPSDQPRASAASQPIAPAPKPEVTRVHGAIEGKIFLAQNRVVVGEPVVAVLELHPTAAPLTFLDGCDMDNQAGYPMRLALKAYDDQGAIVCDNVEHPAFASYGGGGGTVTLKVSETFRQRAVLNAMCPALASPGDYRLVLHQRLAVGKLQLPVPDAAYPLSCDVYPLHEGSLPPTYERGCAAMVEALPSITSEVALHVAPFDAAVVRAATDARLREASTPPIDEGARIRLRLWSCDFLACGCPKPPPGGALSDADLVSALPAALPKTFPKNCRSGTP